MLRLGLTSLQERKLSVWKIAEKEACGKFYARMLGSLAFHLRRLRISYKVAHAPPKCPKHLIQHLQGAGGTC